MTTTHALLSIFALLAVAALVDVVRISRVAPAPAVVYAAAVSEVEALVLFPGDPAKQALAVAGKLPISK